MVYTAFIQQLPTASTPSISVISRFEVIAGTTPQQIAYSRQFLSSFKEIDVTPAIAERAGRLFRDWKAKGHFIPSNDLFIGATALDRHLTLLTANQRHFPYLRTVRVEKLQFQTRRGSFQKDTIFFMEP
jgi:predicted nucleic acid-binding protein